MTFYTFMMRNYLDDNGIESDLAHDMKLDKSSFPKNNKGKYSEGHKLIRDYLTDKGVCREALEVFEECWKEYLECEKRK